MPGQNIQYTVSLNDLLTGGLRNAERAANSLENSIGKIGGSINGLIKIAAGLFTLKKAFDFGTDILKVTADFEGLNNVINYTSLNASDAAKNHEFLQHLVDDYKLPIQQTTEGFADFNAALIGSALAGQKARDVFEGVSVASTAMHLKAERVNQVFLALGQMVSKGTVQAQELKLQLGNALPGAFQFAAKAMGVTTRELGKMMESGQLVAEDFLPKFAAELKKTFSGAIPQAVNSLIAKQTELSNKWIEFKLQLGESLYPVFSKILGTLTDFVTKASSIWTSIIKSPEVQGFMNFIGAIRDKIMGIAYSLREPFRHLADATAEWRGPITDFAMGLATIFSVIFDLLGKILPHVVNITTKISIMAKGINDFLEKIGAMKMLVQNLNLILLIIEKIGDAIAWVFDNVIEPAMDLFIKVIDMFNGVYRDLSGAAAPNNTGPSVLGFINPTPMDSMLNDWIKGAKPGAAIGQQYGGSLGASSGIGADEKGKSSKVTGQRIINIDIKIQKLVETFNVNTTNMVEGSRRSKEMVQQALISAVNDSQLVPDK